MRLIDADALLDKFYQERPTITDVDDYYYLVEQAPTIDAIPAVLCEDCKHFEFDKLYANHACLMCGETVRCDDYCSQSVRKEETHE